MTLTTVIVCEPDRAPYKAEVEENLKSYQKLVGGYIQLIKLKTGLLLICNEEGKLNNLPFNMMIEGHKVVGTFVLVRDKGAEFVSVNEFDLKEWIK